MNCNFCNNCDDPKYDNCVFYTGVDVDALGIKNGMTLSEVEDILFTFIQSLNKGENIISIEIGDTTLLNLLKGKDYTIENIIQAIYTYSEGLDGRLSVLEETVNKPFVINDSCLTLPSNPTKDDVIKATVQKLCSLDSTVTTIGNDYIKNEDLCSLVKSCIEAINEDQNSSSNIVQEYTKMPKNCPIPYVGSLSVFDGTGKGIASVGYDKVYICNGNNSTIDMRGFSIIGANINVVGPSLSPLVDPALQANTGYGIAIGSKKGTFTHSLTADQNAPHNHTLNDPGHDHYTVSSSGSAGASLTGSNYVRKENSYNGNPSYNLAGTPDFPSLGKSGKSFTGITLSSSGLGTPHNNLHPTVGVVYIIYLP